MPRRSCWSTTTAIWWRRSKRSLGRVATRSRTASNSKEAYKRIVEDKPDLIVLDVMMDYDEEGMVLASALKTDGPTRDIPIVMLSGFNVQKDVREKVLASLMGQDWPAESIHAETGPAGRAGREDRNAPRPGRRTAQTLAPRGGLDRGLATN